MLGLDGRRIRRAPRSSARSTLESASTASTSASNRGRVTESAPNRGLAGDESSPNRGLAAADGPSPPRRRARTSIDGGGGQLVTPKSVGRMKMPPDPQPPRWIHGMCQQGSWGRPPAFEVEGRGRRRVGSSHCCRSNLDRRWGK